MSDVTVSYDADGWCCPLRCPTCGWRGDDGRYIWVEMLVGTVRGTPRHMLASSAEPAVLAICGRCGHRAVVSTFAPPWSEPTGVATRGNGTQRVLRSFDLLPLIEADRTLSRLHEAAHEAASVADQGQPHSD